MPQASLVPVWSCFCRQAGIIFEKVLDSCSGNHCCFQNSNHSDAHWWNHVMIKKIDILILCAPHLMICMPSAAIIPRLNPQVWPCGCQTCCKARTMQISTTGYLRCKFRRSFAIEAPVGGKKVWSIKDPKTISKQKLDRAPFRSPPVRFEHRDTSVHIVWFSVVWGTLLPVVLSLLLCLCEHQQKALPRDAG